MIWWMIQTMVVTAVMTLIVGALGRWSRTGPATLHLLWVLVLIRMIVPPVLTWPWPLTSLWEDQGAAVSTATNGPAPLLRLIGNYTASQTAESTSVPAVSTVSPSLWDPIASLTLTQWLFLAWGLSVAVVAVMQLIRIVRMYRLVRRSADAPQWMQTDADLLGLRLRVTAPVVELTPSLPVPVYWNIGRPRLLMPKDLVGVLDREAWSSIFLHELAHHKRRDHWVGWLELVVGCVWWWNPVYWFARRRLRECAELACDAWVVTEMPEKRRTYADALLHVFEGVSRNARRSLAWNTTADIRLGFERRLKMIYADTVRRKLHPLSWFAIALIAVAVVPVWSLDNAPAQPSEAMVAVETPTSVAADDSDEGPLHDVMGSMVSIEFEKEHLSAICGFLSDYVNVNIVLDYRVIKQRSGRDIVPNPEYVTDGFVPYINLRNVPLREALRALCRPLDLGYETTPGFIWITSLKNLEKETWPLPKRGTGFDYEPTVNDGRVSVEFEDEHISRICEFIADYTDVNIMLDTRVIAPVPAREDDGETPGPARDSAEATAPPTGMTGNKIVTTGIVPFISLRDVTLHQALLALLRPLNLAYRMEPGFIWISSPERMAEESFTLAPEPKPDETDPNL